MELLNTVSDVFHRMRVKLYPNYLPKIEGAYIARTASEASLSVEQVCAALKKRGGYTGRYEDLVSAVKGFFDEAAYQLCDGYAVNMRYFTIVPNLGGVLNSAAEVNDHKKHPVEFRFRSLEPLRRLARNIVVEVEGIAENTAYIDEFIDTITDTVNDSVTPGGVFIIHGYRIKAVGSQPGIGVYFESVEDGGRRIKVEAPLVENSPSKIIGVAPALPEGSVYRVIIVTQFSSGSNFLKEPRTITGRSSLELN